MGYHNYQTSRTACLIVSTGHGTIALAKDHVLLSSRVLARALGLNDVVLHAACGA
ncbi:hypothetical protein BC943DRAFT_322612 [Umbelopsis sp. AD052]|nr:hypothetical protein BC943DRAFT_322612 [Umbelopsis sp. AD052]